MTRWWRNQRGNKAGTRAATPTILQMEAVECGAASLAMVLGHFGRWVPLEVLRVACGVSRDGSKASNVLKAARSYGLAAKGFRKTPEKLLEMPMPVILHWNFNHYLVLEGVKGDRVYLNDPISGPRTVSHDELDAGFTGVVLAFEPTEDFTKGGQRPSMLMDLARRLRHSRAGLALIALASLLLVVPGIIIPVFSKVFVDDILLGQLEDWFIPLCIGMAFTALIRGLLTALQQRYLLRLESKLAVTMASDYLHRLMQLPMDFFNQRHAGDLANRVAAGDRIAGLLSGELATNLFNLVAVFFYALVMFTYDVSLTLAVLGLASVNFIALKWVARKREDLNRSLLNEQGKLLAATVGSIRSIESLKANGAEDDAFVRWSGFQANTLQRQQALGKVSSRLNILPTLLTALTTVAVLAMAGLQIMAGQMTIGTLVAFQSLMASFTAPIASLVRLGGNLQAIKGDLIRLADVLYHQPVAQTTDLEHWQQAKPQAKLRAELKLTDIHFGYSRLDPALIKDFSLSLRPGSRIALVGGSGSGKSTIGRLICGLYSPWQGEIRIDGHVLDDIPALIRANSLAYVDQETFLFAGTVRDNLTLWDPSISDEAISRALKDAEIHAEIAARPLHFDSPVSEGGINFSGGQRQRLEIARALIHDPSLLVLDEATAALDPVTEKAIDNHIRRRGCACIIIAHRLSTIRDCDEIIVLKHGQVVERGNHQSLLDQGGEYTHLVANS